MEQLKKYKKYDGEPLPYIMSNNDKKLKDKMAEEDVDVSVEAPGVLHVTNKKKKVPSYKKGGKVKKTGLALLHKGEGVLPVNSMRALMDGDSSIASKIAKKRGK
jgi:hypothetical protein